MIELIKKNSEIIRYLIIGVLTTLISMGVYYLCVNTFLNPNEPVELQIANIISWIVSVTFAFFTNRSYVFKSENSNKLKEAGVFYGSRVGTLLIDMGLMFIFVTLLSLNDKIVKVFVQFVVVVLNYIISKLFVFKKNN